MMQSIIPIAFGAEHELLVSKWQVPTAADIIVRLCEMCCPHPAYECRLVADLFDLHVPAHFYYGLVWAVAPRWLIHLLHINGDDTCHYILCNAMAMVFW